MTEIRDQETIGAAWKAAVRRWSGNPYIIAPRNPARAYFPDGFERSYAAIDAMIDALVDQYSAAGYGVGHRVALFLDNRPEHVILKLALNSIGVSCVPINPDYRAAEIQYLIEHSEPELVLVTQTRAKQCSDGVALSSHKPAVQEISDCTFPDPPPPRRKAAIATPSPTTESSILYTSGTTGKPKGCIISHGYEIAMGERYASLGGIAKLHEGSERIYNPLPLYHVNSGIVSLIGAMLSGNAQVQPDRFHPERWWTEVVSTEATVVHYLGVVIQMLMLQAPSAASAGHKVRFGFGAGVEPQLHQAFENRFGFPLIEVWGMTEMCRVLASSDSLSPRTVGKRAFGRAVPGLDVRVVDERDREVPDGTPGEMLVRHSAETPRRGAFSGYLKSEAETEEGWRGGWWHTGDTVTRAADGMLHFVDRKKNIIRRSGENIAAAEVEALLATHPNVAQCAVLAVDDEMREEEVLACIVLKAGIGDEPQAREIFDFVNARLAYYKSPGWVWFARELPTTGTQKIQKHTIFPAGGDPRKATGMIDLRALKRRS